MKPICAAAVLVLALAPACGAGGSGNAPAAGYTDPLDSLDYLFFKDLEPGDTAYHFIYADDPSWGEIVMVGRVYRLGAGRLVQNWRQPGRWPTGADTIWIWEGLYLASNGTSRGLTITKWLLSDPDWGMVIVSSQGKPIPRLGATWERTALPYLVLGKAFEHLKR